MPHCDEVQYEVVGGKRQRQACSTLSRRQTAWDSSALHPLHGPQSITAPHSLLHMMLGTKLGPGPPLAMSDMSWSVGRILCPAWRWISTATTTEPLTPPTSPTNRADRSQPDIPPGGTGGEASSSSVVAATALCPRRSSWTRWDCRLPRSAAVFSHPCRRLSRTAPTCPPVYLDKTSSVLDPHSLITASVVRGASASRTMPTLRNATWPHYSVRGVAKFSATRAHGRLLLTRAHLHVLARCILGRAHCQRCHRLRRVPMMSHDSVALCLLARPPAI